MIEIRNRFGNLLYTVESRTLQGVDLSCINLNGADLAGADLRLAKLRGTDLVSANLEQANLHGVGFHGADLSNANLRGANLKYADLSGAKLPFTCLNDADMTFTLLRETYLHHTQLKNIKMNWNSHELIAEILRRAAKDDIEKCKLAGYILLHPHKCWSGFLHINDPLTEWALSELAKYVRSDDELPRQLKLYVDGKLKIRKSPIKRIMARLGVRF